ncbi:iron chaperone [Clostridium fungisolvens]|uniref:YdhG-like domain-containing protein n=1 Tax=Clostridium fungisolvens TaxID=1604897 RepID=A0A6V8SG43_9CLOT|nr:DUF1801 domain-containing protein [Clostridium fungisolvens]GFP76147.1 hypothetical protein bsdtw1_02245 [Clostridium fungisolvens]
MEESKKTIESIDEYISSCPSEVQEVLENLRKVIKEAAPEATEKISYQMPTFFLYGNLVHFAAFKNHIGFYPTSSGIEAFKHELTQYKSSKGAVQFPKSEPLPYELVSKIVKYRVVENIKKAEEKATRKKK